MQIMQKRTTPLEKKTGWSHNPKVERSPLGRGALVVVAGGAGRVDAGIVQRELHRQGRRGRGMAGLNRTPACWSHSPEPTLRCRCLADNSDPRDHFQNVASNKRTPTIPRF